AVEELLRYDGPLERATMRFSLEAVTVGGVTIPAHRLVGLVMASADHDPARFEDPDRLDLTRPRPQHLEFGHGIHFCLGAPLARLEGQVAFGRLLERYPDMVLACPVEDLRFAMAGYVARGLRTLPVRLHGPRQPRFRVKGGPWVPS
ncbi:MAG: cytochrome P450, partial [Candidatus Dormibacteraeota bacterium]|nr:cytochrome P450 [Candidatus Dormibacteraeota bacterium]